MPTKRIAGAGSLKVTKGKAPRKRVLAAHPYSRTQRMTRGGEWASQNRFAQWCEKRREEWKREAAFFQTSGKTEAVA